MKNVNAALQKTQVRFGSSFSSYALDFERVFITYHNGSECLWTMIHEIAHCAIESVLTDVDPLGHGVNEEVMTFEENVKFNNREEDISLFFELLFLRDRCTNFEYARYIRVIQLFWNMVLAAIFCDVFGDFGSPKIDAEIPKVVIKMEDGTERRLNALKAVGRLKKEIGRLDIEADALKADADDLEEDINSLLKNNPEFNITELENEKRRLRVKANESERRSGMLKKAVDGLESSGKKAQKARDSIEKLREKIETLIRNPRAYLMKDPKWRAYVEGIPREGLFWKYFLKSLECTKIVKNLLNSIELRENGEGEIFFECQLKVQKTWVIGRDSVNIQENVTDSYPYFIFNEYTNGLCNAVDLLQSGQSMDEILTALKAPRSNATSPENVKNTCIFFLDMFCRSWGHGMKFTSRSFRK
jgi:hypothetical protein